MTKIKFYSVNVRGLRDGAKRRDVLNYLNSLKYSIFCLQDTHWTSDLEQKVRAKWGEDCFCSAIINQIPGV